MLSFWRIISYFVKISVVGRLKRVLVILFLMCPVIMSGQASRDTVQVFFKHGEVVLEDDYMFNKAILDDFIDRIIALYRVPGHRTHQITIFSGASPEGTSTHNDWLSQKRAEAIKDYLVNHTPLPEEMFVIKSVGTDWEGLERLVKQRYDVPYREEVLKILQYTPLWIRVGGAITDGRKLQLQRLHGGYPWRWMNDHLFPELRQSSARVDYNVDRPQPVSPPVFRTDTVSIRDTVYIRDTIIISRCCPYRIGLKTNLLYDAAAVPNIGIELPLGRKWSLAANWMYSWWHSDRIHWYWRTYGGDVALRRWFGGREGRPLTGHHLGVYGQMVTYDFELGARGILGDRWSYAGGLEYGYALPVGRNLNLDFNLGVGYLQGIYKEYLPIDDCYVWQATKMRRWLGPTKLEISLVWMIGGRDRDDRKKGGGR